MAKVHNWQLGRGMSYPYDAAYPKRQFAFVFNINRCIACQTCTMACKSTWTFSKGQEHMWWANVETKPYGGYPQSWDIKTLRLLEEANPGGQGWRDGVDGRRAPYGQFGGDTIFEAPLPQQAATSQRVLGYLPTDEEWNSPNIWEEIPWGRGASAMSFTPRAWSCRPTTPGSSTWLASATTAATRRASRPARAKPSTSGRRTASS